MNNLTKDLLYQILEYVYDANSLKPILRVYDAVQENQKRIISEWLMTKKDDLRVLAYKLCLNRFLKEINYDIFFSFEDSFDFEDLGYSHVYKYSLGIELGKVFMHCLNSSEKKMIDDAYDNSLVEYPLEIYDLIDIMKHDGYTKGIKKKVKVVYNVYKELYKKYEQDQRTQVIFKMNHQEINLLIRLVDDLIKDLELNNLKREEIVRYNQDLRLRRNFIESIFML